ncbi:hypothetical protein ILUMI_02325 [Ignelater luminosus]|uniref:Uncharacterized protein n=1 Tax=Ignelater luminosus TaxID=2038154 RepID=A0A8K0GJD5_IGNLU|nr:hypothetical protein ILUMI_02325 [Ignelater luminosus]
MKSSSAKPASYLAFRSLLGNELINDFSSRKPTGLSATTFTKINKVEERKVSTDLVTGVSMVGEHLPIKAVKLGLAVIGQRARVGPKTAPTHSLAVGRSPSSGGKVESGLSVKTALIRSLAVTGQRLGVNQRRFLFPASPLVTLPAPVEDENFQIFLLLKMSSSDQVDVLMANAEFIVSSKQRKIIRIQLLNPSSGFFLTDVTLILFADA